MPDYLPHQRSIPAERMKKRRPHLVPSGRNRDRLSSLPPVRPITTRPRAWFEHPLQKRMQERARMAAAPLGLHRSA